MNAIKLFTRKTPRVFKEEGGVGWWRLSSERAELCEYVVCIHNTPRDLSRHHTAFFIGRIKQPKRADRPDKDGKFRYILEVSEFAAINVAASWDGERNPVRYIDIGELGIDPSKLVWQPLEHQVRDTPLSSADTAFDQLSHDLEAVQSDPTISATTRQALISARLGQGRFRRHLLDIWGGMCPVTCCTIPEVLRASHILAWSDKRSTNKKRLDPHNGVLLAASIDELFDRHLISFSDEGDILFSDGIEEQAMELGIQCTNIGRLTPEQKQYMELHRTIFYS